MNCPGCGKYLGSAFAVRLHWLALYSREAALRIALRAVLLLGRPTR